MRFICTSIILALSNLIPANPVLVRETDPLTPEEELKGFSVPNDFKIQLFASEPMINKPINLAWDKRGRLWVSSTVEYPYAAAKSRWADQQGSRVRDSRDAIKILEDIDGDGKADTVTDFADGLNIPTGVVPWHRPEHKDGCIAWSIPNIWYFADTTGDGKADLREVLFGPMGYERDTHGMCSSFRLGHDGWVYATHGFNNTSIVTASDGSSVEMNSGNVFRFNPDGSRIEVWSHGQVNPFGLCFDKRGNLYSADCHSAPIYQLIRGAYYPSFGKPHDGMGFGPTMIQHTHGSTGICGIVLVDRNQWGRRWNYRMLIGNPVNSVINHDGIKYAGTTPVAVEQPDFMTSKDPWFRPVDLCLGGDGALYVADFYNKIIGHYEVPLDHSGRDRKRGRIWRITPKTGPLAPGPRSLPESGGNPVEELESRSPHIRRNAAAELQQNPRAEALIPLLELYYRERADDTHLRHVIRLAIRSQLGSPGALDGETVSRLLPTDIALASPTPSSSAFLLQRLQQSPRLRDTLEILSHLARHGKREVLEGAVAWMKHQENRPSSVRAGQFNAFMRGRQERGELTLDPSLIEMGQDIARSLLAERHERSWSLSSHPAHPKSASPWTLQQRECEDGQTVSVISSLALGRPGAESRTGILRSSPFIARDTISFWICGHRGHPDQPPHENNFVRLTDSKTGKELRRAYPPRNDRAIKVEWKLSSMRGRQVELEVIDGDSGPSFAWLAITRLAPPAAQVESFAPSAAHGGLLEDLARVLLVSAPADLRDQLKAFLPSLPATSPTLPTSKERSRLEKVIRKRVESFELAQPQMENGKAIFKTHCASCHQVAGEGALLGPQLDGIGARGAARLTEDILDPNRNVDAHFFLTTLTLKNGTSTAGFVRGESGEVILLVDATGKEYRIEKSSITASDTLARSLMPSSFEHLLKEGEFHDLLGWLLSERNQ